ncbi:MAG: 2-C-methyl-D-erythritol 4-phosphate cytidylyltransferase [Candidatus Dadabacteria bacterium]|nr:MAG: 2-C-methyl-D-erythritol 4-phosphate cytidylyltransferase [Candidatus Dadabacteria bacterium]
MISEQKIYGIVPAAGKGSRAGGGLNKVFRELAGRPLLLRTLDALYNTGLFERIVVVVSKENLILAREMLAEFKSVVLVIGGERRQDSVRNALNYLESEIQVDSSAYVVIHDAARCFVSPALVKATLAAAIESGAASAGLPCIDSLKEVDNNNLVVRSVDRNSYWIVQTPQVFSLAVLLKAHAELDGEFTDDASMVEQFSTVRMVLGERTNIKVTYPEDFELGEILCKQKQQSSNF